uniref:protein-glutamine gamma-glutamyltransferase 2-like n=1 Tax=Pristiophorus japonicus TaxID=55135 RepID=UPI00398E864B
MAYCTTCTRTGVSSKCRVDFQFEKNNMEHRTDEISTKRLIVRRGQIFNIKVDFTDGSNLEMTKFRLIFETGPKPSTAIRTKIVVPFTKSIDFKRWSAIISSSTKSEWCLAISPSPEAMIGYHRLILQHTDDEDVKHYLGNFVVLFNPWCSEDEVFLNSDLQRDEYVMNETGIIYAGATEDISFFSWNFGQFEEDILDICLKILDNAPKYLKNPNQALQKTGSSVYIVRTVSAMVNSKDDKGVLQGKWKEPYTDGVYPGKWNGSVAILRQWSNTDYQPVRYGQCWVFAGVTCTVLRCLGIPTRVVTNFDSAHDTDANLSIDTYYDVEGNNMAETRDSIWNFHVWNECWMRRSDGHSGYDGWQAMDATPQVKSDGVYQCGPASVKAIKEGKMDMKYDLPFIFAEVNALCVKWLVDKDGLKVMNMDDLKIGQNVSTKSCGSDKREDITSYYKYPDGSSEEQLVFERANRMQNMPKEDRILSLSITTDKVLYNGKPFVVTLVVSNNTSEKKDCSLLFQTNKRRYTGFSGPQVKTIKQEITIAPNEVKVIDLTLDYEEYGRFLDMYNLMTLILIVIDLSSKRKTAVIKDITLINPPLTIKIPMGPVVLNTKLNAEISFLNTFPDTLKDCVMTLEGAGLIKGEKQINFADIEPNQTATVRYDFVPYKSGMKRLLVDFDCDKLQDVKGSLNIVVQDK